MHFCRQFSILWNQTHLADKFTESFAGCADILNSFQSCDQVAVDFASAGKDLGWLVALDGLKLWVPIASALVAKVALPLLMVPVPSVVVPSLKVTVPVGLLPVMVAVIVTLWPSVAGFGETARVFCWCWPC